VKKYDIDYFACLLWHEFYGFSEPIKQFKRIVWADLLPDEKQPYITRAKNIIEKLNNQR
jgi:hypothetical protein